MGAAFGAWAIAEGPGRFTTYAGSAEVWDTLTLCAGLGLVAAGIALSLGRGAGRMIDLALLAGIAWFAPVSVGWEEGPAILRTIAMALAGLTFPLVFNLGNGLRELSTPYHLAHGLLDQRKLPQRPD